MKKLISRTRNQVYSLWLKALRSGEYKRAKGQLRKTSTSGVQSFCCLGVLQDLAAKDGGNKWFDDDNASWDTEIPANRVRVSDSQPQQEILDFLGIDNRMVDSLIELNDDKDRSFKEIADYIEKKILPVV